MVLLTKQGTDYILEDDRGKKLGELLATQPNPSRVLDLYSDGSAMVPVSSIAELMTDAKFDEYTHTRKGETKCKQGYWHAKNNICAHVEKIDLSYLRQDPIPNPTIKRDEYMNVIRRNMAELKKGGSFGMECMCGNECECIQGARRVEHEA